MNSSAPENNNTEKRNIPLQQNGQRISIGKEDQHASKLHFFQGKFHAEIHISERWLHVFVHSSFTLSFCDKRLFHDVFFIDPERNSEPKKQELWKTSSLDRNPQLNQAHVVKRYARMLCVCVCSRLYVFWSYSLLLYFSLE